MLDRTRGAALLFVWGLLVLGGGFFLYDPTSYAPESVAGGLRWLTVLVACLLGGSLIISGIRVRRLGLGYVGRMRVPALTLTGIGVIAIGGSGPVFRPWAFEGLAGGLRWGAVVVFVIGGGLFAVIGFRCYRARTPRIPLILLAGLTGVGAFYPLDGAGLLRGTHPLVWVALVVVFVVGPPLGVFYGWPELSDTASIVEE